MSKNPKILIVDDEATNRFLVKSMLAQKNYQILDTKSGREAIILLEADPDIDVMLLDMMMPGENGLEVLKMTKDNPQTAKIKVILFSAVSDVSVKVRAFSAGAADYIEKPFDTAELLARIETQVRLSRAEKELRQNQIKMQALLNTIPDLIFRISKEGVYLDFKGAYTNTLATHPEQMVGKSLYDVLPQEVADERMHYIHQALATGQLQIFEYKLTINDLSHDFEARIVVNGEDEVLLIARDITERVRIKEALQRSEKEFRALYEEAPIAYYAVGTDGRIHNANPRTAEMSGYALDDLIGLPVSNLYADRPTGKGKVAKLSSRINAGEEIRGEELEWRTADGKPVWISLTVRPHQDVEGRVVESRAVAVDITERKQAEQALQEEKALMDALMENSLDSIYFKDRQCRLTRISRKMMNDLKLTEMSQVLGKTDVDLFGREFGTRTLVDDQKIMVTGKPIVGLIESRALENGQTNWTMTTKVPLRDNSGQIVGLVGVTREINDIKQTMDVLRKFSRAIEHSASAIVITNHQGIIEYVNPAFTQIAGYSFGEAMGNNLEILNPGDYPPEFYKEMKATLAKGEVWMGELHSKKKSGELFWRYTTISPVKDDDGKITHNVFIMEDITQRKLMETELQQAKEAAEAAAQAKSEFLANMSHEIRTPMNGVIGMTSLLLDTDLTPHQRDFAEIIRTSGDTLLTIVNDILDFSKLEANKLELEGQPFMLGNCIEEALDLVASKAAEKGLELVYLIDDNVPEMFEGDVTRLRQILVNLLSNAVKFTDTGEVFVSVTGHKVLPSTSPLQSERTKERYKLQFAVRDTGIGISKDHRKHLFKSFSQVDASTSRRFGGTGLGLAISKRLSEMMGGTMWVESEVGRGSIFYFTISVKATSHEKQPFVHGVPSHLVGKHILIVDDNETNRRIISHHVASWGMTPVTAASGPQVLELILQGEHFDLAILDMQMPDMDGLTLATKIRDLEHQNSKSKLPLIMLSSLGRQSDKNKHFAAYLTKPVKPSHLYNVLAEILVGQPAEVKKVLPQLQFDRYMGQNHPLQILLAEDNVVNQKVALAILERHGYQADVAANGLEVLDALERQPYDVVLMDIQMPEMDGLTATQQIRRQLARTHQPWIIAMTANALQGDREKYLAMGMDDYVAKPVQVSELITVLSQCQPYIRQSENSKLIPENSTSTLATTSNVGQNAENSTFSAMEVVTDTPQNDQIDSPSVVAAIDMTALKRYQAQLGADGPELMREFISIFLADTLEKLGQLQKSLTEEDATTLHRTAHTLKSNSATFGAFNLSTLCIQLEQDTKAGSLAGAEIIVADIREEFKRVQTELMHYREVSLL